MNAFWGLTLVILILLLVIMVMVIINIKNRNEEANKVIIFLSTCAVMFILALFIMCIEYPICNHISAQTYLVDGDTLIMYNDKCERINGDIFYERDIEYLHSD